LSELSVSEPFIRFDDSETCLTTVWLTTSGWLCRLGLGRPSAGWLPSLNEGFSVKTKSPTLALSRSLAGKGFPRTYPRRIDRQSGDFTTACHYSGTARSKIRSTIRSTKSEVLYDLGGFRRSPRVCKSLKNLKRQDCPGADFAPGNFAPSQKASDWHRRSRYVSKKPVAELQCVNARCAVAWPRPTIRGHPVVMAVIRPLLHLYY